VSDSEVSDIFRRLQQRQYLPEFPHMLRIDAAPVVVLEQPFQTFVLETLDHYRGHPASRAGVKRNFTCVKSHLTF